MDDLRPNSEQDIQLPSLIDIDPPIRRSHSAISNKPRSLNLNSANNPHSTDRKTSHRHRSVRTPLSARDRSALSPFEKIKLHTNRNAAHGHPLILPSSYGDFGPVFDVIALFQNAVKRQVLVAYDMVEAMTRNKYEVTHVELNMFLDWFDTFEEMLRVSFIVEETEVYPYLNLVKVPIPEQLHAQRRKQMTDAIRTSIERITEKREMFQYLPAGESVPRFTKLLNDFLNLTVQYYDVQSETLPRLIFEADIDADMELVLRQRCMNALKCSSDFTMTIPFLTHWLTQKQLKSWKANYLGARDALRYDQWAKKFEARHQSIPGKIHKNLTKAAQENRPSPSNVASPSGVPATPRFGRRNKSGQSGSALGGRRSRSSADTSVNSTPRSVPLTPRFGRKMKHTLKE